MRAAVIAGLSVWLMSAPAAAAISPDEMLSDPALEARARALARELRCLVCQNQSIDDSNAPLAADLRRIVRERLLAGDSEDEIKAYLVTRYGKFVLLKPPVEPATWPLWAGPFALLLCGALGVAWYLRTRSAATSAETELSEEDRQRLAALLGGKER